MDGSLLLVKDRLPARCWNGGARVQRCNEEIQTCSPRCLFMNQWVMMEKEAEGVKGPCSTMSMGIAKACRRSARGRGL